MAKLDKRETRSLAIRIVRSLDQFKDLTVEKVNEMNLPTYADKQQFAFKLLHHGMVITNSEISKVKAANMKDFNEAFIDEVINRLTAPEVERRRAIDRFRSELGRSITLDVMMKRLIDHVKSMNIRGARLSERHSGLYLTVTRGWSIEVNLSIDFNRSFDSSQRMVNPENDKQAIGRYSHKLDITWSSTQRSLASAQASVVLYQEIVNIAAELESMIEDKTVRWEMGFDEEVVARAVEGAEQMKPIVGKVGEAVDA